ncbi:MAG: DUF6399 domain-containing protein [Cyanobacteria bacterium J06623_5]
MANPSKSRIIDIVAATGLKKSSVQRHQKGIERRNQYAESNLWETAAGAAWLERLVVAVVYHFGIQQGVGAESLSRFFKAIHIETHVGISPSALRSLKVRLHETVAAYAAAQAEHCHPQPGQGICIGADETFFDLPILVLIELASGFIFTEVKSAARTYQSWSAQLQTWWKDSQWACHFLVSDGARALVKLAVSGLGCVSVPDLFHAMRALGRPLGGRLARQLRAAHKQVDKLSERLTKTTDDVKRQTLEEQLTEALSQQQQGEQNQQTYHNALETISTCIHPFCLETAQPQTDDTLTAALAAPLKVLAGLASLDNTAPVEKAIGTFEDQIPDFAAGIQAWWQWTTQALAAETEAGDTQNWVLTAMLPWVYWTQQADKTRQPALKRQYQTAASDAFDALIAHPCTGQTDHLEQKRWQRWCQWMVAKYQRTSSAVEGRNGYLAQRHHVTRGFSEQSLKTLTTIHNFGIKRDDGSTAAQRLFDYDFPDLFEWVLSHNTDLPLPRKSPKALPLNPSHAELFPA